MFKGAGWRGYSERCGRRLGYPRHVRVSAYQRSGSQSFQSPLAMLRTLRPFPASACSFAFASGEACVKVDAKILGDDCGEAPQLASLRATAQRPAIISSQSDLPIVTIRTSPMRGSFLHASARSASETPATRPHPAYPPEQRLDGIAHSSKQPNAPGLALRLFPPCGVHMANKITSTAPTATLFSACERLRQLPRDSLIFIATLTWNNRRAFF